MENLTTLQIIFVLLVFPTNENTTLHTHTPTQITMLFTTQICASYIDSQHLQYFTQTNPVNKIGIGFSISKPKLPINVILSETPNCFFFLPLGYPVINLVYCS